MIIIETIFKFDARALSHALNGTGALYHPIDMPSGIKHLPALGPNDASNRWVLGPTTNRRFLTIEEENSLWTEISQTPVLWHKKHTEILGLIDWQNAYVAPLFDQVMHLAFLDYKGPKIEGLMAPHLPEDLDEHDDDTKKHANKLLVDRTLYNTMIFTWLPRIYPPIML
jgi:hypothetical protein